MNTAYSVIASNTSQLCTKYETVFAIKREFFVTMSVHMEIYQYGFCSITKHYYPPC